MPTICATLLTRCGFILVAAAVCAGAPAALARQSGSAQPASSAQASGGGNGTIEVSPDRPDATDGTDIVPLGHVQIEGGMTVEQSGDERDVSIGEVLVRVPVARNVEARVGAPSFLLACPTGDAPHDDCAKGADDLFLETKVRLLSREKAALAVLVNASLPTGSRAVAEHRFQPGATLAADLAISDAVSLSLNLGAARASDAGERFNQVSASGSLGFDLSPRVGAFAELYAFDRTEPHGHAQRYADTGVSYRVGSRTVVDARVGSGLANGTGGSDYFFGFGITRLF